MRYLLCVFFSALLVVAPQLQAQKVNTEPFNAEQQLELEKLKNEYSIQLQARDAKIAQLQSDLGAQEKYGQGVLENGWKSVDSWLTFVAFILAIVALVVPALAWRFKRNIENDWQNAKDDALKLRDDCLEKLAEVELQFKKSKDRADDYINQIDQQVSQSQNEWQEAKAEIEKLSENFSIRFEEAESQLNSSHQIALNYIEQIEEQFELGKNERNKSKLALDQLQQQIEEQFSKTETETKELTNKATDLINQLDNHVLDGQRKAQSIPSPDELELMNEQQIAAMWERIRKEKPPYIVSLIEVAYGFYNSSDWKKALPRLRALSVINGGDSGVWYRLAYCLSEIAKVNNEPSKIEYLKESISAYEFATFLEPAHASSYLNWGVGLSRLSELSGDVNTKIIFYAESVEKYEKALELREDFFLASQNLGIAFKDLAKLAKLPAEKHEYFEKSDINYAKAAQIDPTSANIFKWWAYMLELWAETLDGDKKQEILNKATEKRVEGERLLIEQASSA